MKPVYFDNAVKPVGHYAPGIVHNGLVYVSGQMPMDLETRKPFAGDIGRQTELALKNVEAVLNEAGSDLDHVLQMTIYVSDMKLWDKGQRGVCSHYGRSSSRESDDPGKGSAFWNADRDIGHRRDN